MERISRKLIKQTTDECETPGTAAEKETQTQTKILSNLKGFLEQFRRARNQHHIRTVLKIVEKLRNILKTPAPL